MSYCIPRVAAQATLLAALLAGHAAPDVQAATQEAATGKTGEFWEMTQSMRMEGMSMPGMTHKVCIPKDAPSDRLAPKSEDNCKTTSFKQSGNKTTYSIVCTGKDAMTGTGEFERLGPDAYRGRNTMRSADGEVSMEFEGRKVGGACDPEEPMKRAQAQTLAAMADACRDLGDSLAPIEVSAGAPDLGCGTTHKAAYCEGVRAAAKEVTDREKFRSLNGKAEWRKAFAACGLDAAALERKFCGTAVRDKDWSYVAEACETDARAIAARCAGRDTTSLSAAGQSDLLAICQKYGPGAPEIVEGSAPATAEPEPAPAKPSALDKLKKGTKGLGDLFRVPRP